MEFIILMIAIPTILWILEKCNINIQSKQDLEDSEMYKSMYKNVSSKSIKEYREELEKDKKLAYELRLESYIKEQNEYFDEQEKRFNNTYNEYLKSPRF